MIHDLPAFSPVLVFLNQFLILLIWQFVKRIPANSGISTIIKYFYLIATRSFHFIQREHVIVKLSLFLYLSQSLYISERYNNHFPPTTTNQKLLRTLELTYTQVWYIIGIVSSSSTSFHSEIIGLGHYSPLSAIGLRYIHLVVELVRQSVRLCQWVSQSDRLGQPV